MTSDALHAVGNIFKPAGASAQSIYELSILVMSAAIRSRSLDRRAHSEFVWPMGLAMAQAHLENESTALDFLERAYEERVGWMPLIGREPAFHILRSSPRFAQLLAKIGPPQARLGRHPRTN